MIQAITFTNRFGRSLRCVLREPERSGFAIKSIDGLGPGRSSVNIHDIATADGGYFGSARFSSRNIFVNFQLVDFDIDWNYNPIEQVRHLSYEFFPPKTRVQIVVDTDSRSLVIEGYVESNEPNIFQQSATVSVSILCPGYYFKMVTDGGSQQNVNIYGTGLFQFPFSNESLKKKLIQFGEIKPQQKYELYYDGDAETGFEMEILFNGLTVSGFSIANQPIGNSDKGPIGFISPADAHRVVYNWNDDQIASKYIQVTLSRIASKLNGLYSNPIYTSGNRILISSAVGRKSAMFIDENNHAYNILDCFDHLDWLKVYPGYNEFEITTDLASVAHFAVNLRYEALYTGV